MRPSERSGVAPRGGIDTASAGLLGAGLAALVAGFWLQATPRSLGVLDDATARRYVEAATALHGATMDPTSEEAEAAEPEPLRRARDEYRRVEAEVAAARRTEEWAPRALQLIGLGSCLAGAWRLRRAGASGA